MIELVSVLLLSSLFYSALGVFEAVYYHLKREYKPTDPQEIIRMKSWMVRHDKKILVVVRLMYWILCLKYISPLGLLGLMMTFSFIHDGIYYIVRNKLNPKIYLKKFFADAPEDTSYLKLDSNGRIIIGALGLVLIVFSYVVKPLSVILFP